MALYDFECINKECLHKEVVDIPMSDYASGNYIKPVCCMCGNEMRRVISYCPPVHFKGLGFYCNDLAYEKQLKLAEDIAENVYKKRAEKSVKEDPISKDDDFWQELCSQDFAKEHAKREYYTPTGPPSTVIKSLEEKSSFSVAKSGSIVKTEESKQE